MNQHGSIVKSILGREEFLALLAERFPEIYASIDDISDGLLHCEMGDVASATCSRAEQNDLAAVQQHFEFIRELLLHADPALVNAITVSYLENVFLCHPPSNAAEIRNMLPPSLEQQLSQLEAHFSALDRHASGT